MEWVYHILSQLYLCLEANTNFLSTTEESQVNATSSSVTQARQDRQPCRKTAHRARIYDQTFWHAILSFSEALYSSPNVISFIITQPAIPRGPKSFDVTPLFNPHHSKRLIHMPPSSIMKMKKKKSPTFSTVSSDADRRDKRRKDRTKRSEESTEVWVSIKLVSVSVVACKDKRDGQPHPNIPGHRSKTIGSKRPEHLSESSKKARHFRSHHHIIMHPSRHQTRSSL